MTNENQNQNQNQNQNHAEQNASGWADTIIEMYTDEAMERACESVLDVQVRSDWHTPGSTDSDPAEYMILLTTGGPTLYITGDLDHGQPDGRPRLCYQDQPSFSWATYVPEHEDWDAAISWFVNCFYYGE